MKNPEFLSEIKNLSHSEKIEVILFLVTELAQNEGIVNNNDSSLLSQLRNSNEAAHQLMTLLQAEKQVQNV